MYSMGSRVQYHVRMKDLPPEERPRERLLTHGPEVLSDAELLAVLITSGTGTQTALEVAHGLLTLGGGTAGRGQGLRYLVGASVEELSAVPGVGPAKAARIKAAIELRRRLDPPDRAPAVIRSPSDAAALVMEDMRHLDREHFRVILLDTKNQVLGTELVSVGSLSTSIVHPREIFKSPLRRSAAAIILVHNHPSGDPAPSREDIEVTRRLTEAGRLMGIEVLDHLVIGDQRYTSFREQGIA